MSLNFTLPEGTKGVACKLSGGADSSIMYYALCDYIKDKDIDLYAVTVITVDKRLYNYYAQQVIEFTGDKLGVWPKDHIVRYVDGSLTYDPETNYSKAKGYIQGQRDIVTELRLSGKVQALVSGTTTNPPDEFNEWYDKQVGECRRDPDRDVNSNFNKSLVKWQDGKKEFAYNDQFLQTDKKGVAQTYRDYGVFDELYPLTWSCEEPNNLTGHHCGRCFWCFEREWGFGILEHGNDKLKCHDPV